MTKEQLLNFIAQYDEQKGFWRKQVNSRSKRMQCLYDYVQTLPAGDLTDENLQKLDQILKDATNYDQNNLTSKIFEQIALQISIEKVVPKCTTTISLPEIQLSTKLLMQSIIDIAEHNYNYSELKTAAVTVNTILLGKSAEARLFLQLKLKDFCKKAKSLRELSIRQIVCELIKNPDYMDNHKNYFRNLPQELINSLYDYLECAKKMIISGSKPNYLEQLVQNRTEIIRGLFNNPAALFQHTPNTATQLPADNVIILGPDVDPNARNTSITNTK